MQQFELVLKNEKAKIYQRLGFFIILFNIAAFCLLSYYNNDENIRSKSRIGIILIAASFILIKLFYKKRKEIDYTSASLFYIIFTWAMMKLWLPAAVCFLLLILYRIATRPLIVFISETEILYPSFPKRKLLWNDLNNIILKDGLLTIDFKDNKLAQALVINRENDYDFDEKEFNDFCRAQLESVATSRKTN